MLKKPLAFILISLLLLGCNRNRIDNLFTDRQVANFLKSQDSRFRDNFFPMVFKSSDSIISDRCGNKQANWHLKPWEKIDLNNDARTDLLVNVFWNYQNSCFVVLDEGNNLFKLYSLNDVGYPACDVIRPYRVKQQTFVLFHSLKILADTTQQKKFNSVVKYETDTLTYKFNNFIEFNSHLKPGSIKSVTFQSGRCYGTCPVFTVNIFANGEVVYKGEDNSKLKGIFKAVLSKAQLDKIFSLINYSDVRKLDDKYAVNATDNPTVDLKVVFEDGAVKSISDYGERGTFGLKAIYRFFFDLYKNEKWQPAAKQ